MFVLGGALIGAIAGALVAHRRKGRPADIAQYAFVFLMIGALIGLFVTLIIHRAAI